MTDVLPADYVRGRTAKAQARDHSLYEAACRMDWFTVQDLIRETGGLSWHGAGGSLLRSLVRGGQMRIVSPEGSKPHVYAWVARPGGQSHAGLALSGVQARVASIASPDEVAELHRLVLHAIADGHPQAREIARAALATPVRVAS